MDVCLRFIVLSVSRGLASGRSPVQGVQQLSKRFTSKNPSTPQGKRGRLRKEERKNEKINVLHPSHSSDAFTLPASTNKSLALLCSIFYAFLSCLLYALMEMIIVLLKFQCERQ
jgi:hypothetical protein